MNTVPVFVLQLVQNYGNTNDQLSLQMSSKKCRGLNITTLNHVFVTDDIVLKYANTLRILNVNYNQHVTNVSIKELKLLHTLHAHGNLRITDASVKELKQLQYLE